MTKTVWVFPGQGSQAVGMGSDLADVAKDKFAEADDVLGWSVLGLCQSDEAKLADTLYTQPCLYVIECILADLLKAKSMQPDLVAGHSLGEYSALYTAEVFNFVAGLRLVKRRAELMAQAADGAMAALMGFNRDELDDKLATTEGVVLANDNNPGQVVISGTPEAVETVMTGIKAKRAVKLNVSGAFHSPLMAPAAHEFDQILSDLPFKTATIPVLSNVDPTPSTDGDVLKQRLMQQMTGSVRWREISLSLPDQAVETVVEVGPGKVLAGLTKRTCRSLTLKNVGTLEQVETI
ncbi:ACP S-malonyltransferase [Leptolyngbya cf. ectocarpi LEGE 11479]|uniref:Malonyl CoA-acyl carrier protein transacylase n=1 Tax=Leptolyngbya cf. ectocarpi LEGE 11479 TaxID=1828722 RepID=A0A928X028_LEPEC|nr:ACP S-malonyltransferase [Leptolyngbya ectocarpi]MBE9066600.1 ACP S-malonyltransferase [Leptolyngbya cf. ectocarpi LEGE 11479]